MTNVHPRHNNKHVDVLQARNYLRQNIELNSLIGTGFDFHENWDRLSRTPVHKE